MLFTSLEEVQEVLPEYKVYAFSIKYNAELEVYHVELWTDHPMGLDDKFKFSFDVHPGLAYTRATLLKSIKKEADRIVKFHKENTWKKLNH